MATGVARRTRKCAACLRISGLEAIEDTSRDTTVRELTVPGNRHDVPHLSEAGLIKHVVENSTIPVRDGVPALPCEYGTLQTRHMAP